MFGRWRRKREDARAAKQANDTAKLDALKPTIDAQKAQMKQLRDAEDVKILALLTPDQQAQYKAFQAERAAKWQQKRSQQ